ncbi:acyltransferase family protein [Microbacterium gubbeenense]|uniref:acyltransferase family protein n=3 Tax=Microbacterium gubbeenense TaxID=159896 RepID=UPI000424C103|nr:acyltransferase [Microbacterium gubbeenense]
MPGISSRAREDWIDVVRGTAVVLVILVHAMQRTELFTGHQFAGFETLTIVVTPLRLPAMFLLSGLFVARSLAKGPGAYATGKLRRIAWPYLLWSVLLIAFFSVLLETTGIGFGWEVTWRIFFDPIEHMWFLAYLLLYFAVAMLLRWVPAPYLLVGVMALSAVPIEGQWLRFWANASFFFAGVVLAEHRRTLERAVARFWPSVIMLVSAIALSIGHATLFLVLPEAPWNLPIVLMFVLGAAGVARPVASTAWLAAPRYVGVESIVFYIVHWPVVSFVAQFAAAKQADPWLTFAAALAAGLLIPWALAALAARWRPAEALFVWPIRP